jgi:hypothetical protein
MFSLVKAHLDSEKRISSNNYNVQCIWLQLFALCLSRFVRVLRNGSDLIRSCFICLFCFKFMHF